MFSSEYCKIFKNTYFEEHLLTATSDFLKQLQNSGEQLLVHWLLIYTRGELKLYADSCYILCLTYHNTHFSNCKIKWRKIFFRGFVCDAIRPYKEVPVQS